MREINPANAAAELSSPPHCSTEFWQWKSPIPYVFMSLAVAFSIIVVAIVVLACSMYKQSSAAAAGGGGGDEKSGSTASENRTVEMSPSFIVVTAGVAKPTHIAVPVLPSSSVKNHDRTDEKV